MRYADTTQMFRKIITSNVARAATYYIPFCPRYIPKFNYFEFRDAVISECNKVGRQEDHEKIADKVVELYKYDNNRIHINIKFANVNYSMIGNHLGRGMVSRPIIVAAAATMYYGFPMPEILTITGIYIFYDTLNVILLGFQANEFKGMEKCVESINQHVYNGLAMKLQKDLILKSLPQKKE